MNIKNLLLLIITGFVLTFSSGTVQAQSTPMYCIYPFGDSIWAIDTSDFSVLAAHQITVAGSTSTGGNGLAVDPCTGDYYAIVKVTGITGRMLCNMDVNTGVATPIGNTGDNFASICMTDDGTLYGVTGDGGTVSETLYMIDKNTGSTSLITALGRGSDGESIQYCPDNGKIYHWSGRNGAGAAMDVIDPSDSSVTAVTRTGYDYDEVFGSVYIGNGQFLLSNLDQEYVIVDTSGFATLISNVSTHEYQRGMVFRHHDFSVTAQDTFCQNEMFSVLASSWNVDSILINYGDGTSDTTLLDTNTFTHMYSSPGNKSVTVVGAGPGCLRDTISFSVRVLNIPTVGLSPGPMTYFCPGDSVQLTGSSGGTSQWYMNGSMIAGANTPSLWVSSPGMYNMTKTNQNGCTDSASVGVTVNVSPQLGLMGNLSACEGDTAHLMVNPGASFYQWYLNGTAIAGANASGYDATASGQYTVAVTWSPSCSDSLSTPAAVVIDSIPNASFTQSADTIWVGQSVNFTNTSTNGVGDDWDFGDGNTSNQTSPSHSYTNTGTYAVTLTVSDSCGSDVATSQVVVIDSPVGLNPMTDLLANFQGFPNPFEATVTLELELTQSASGRLAVYDLVGKEIAVIREGEFAAGNSKFTWNAGNAPAGMYLVRLETDKGVAMLRLHSMK